MNERIRELEQMCWEELSEEECYYPVFNPKKFAELIVQECAEIALLDGQTTGNFEVFNKIQKHFGVEE